MVRVSFIYSDRNIRVFFLGDYEFLCHMYGLSGASGESHMVNRVFVHTQCDNYIPT